MYKTPLLVGFTVIAEAAVVTWRGTEGDQSKPLILDLNHHRSTGTLAVYVCLQIHSFLRANSYSAVHPVHSPQSQSTSIRECEVNKAW